MLLMEREKTNQTVKTSPILAIAFTTNTSHTNRMVLPRYFALTAYSGI